MQVECKFKTCTDVHPLASAIGQSFTLAHDTCWVQLSLFIYVGLICICSCCTWLWSEASWPPPTRNTTRCSTRLSPSWQIASSRNTPRLSKCCSLLLHKYFLFYNCLSWLSRTELAWLSLCRSVLYCTVIMHYLIYLCYLVSWTRCWVLTNCTFGQRLNDLVLIQGSKTVWTCAWRCFPSVTVTV